MMKFNRLLMMLLGCASATSALAQTTYYDTIVFDGEDRQIYVYVPASYDANTPTPLVLNLHGYGSQNWEQALYGNFTTIADTANFIVVHPNGTFDPNGSRFWNAEINTSAVDDVGFLEALIDEISNQYNINQSRVYSTGMSNGGIMSYYLACHSNRFAAIASVTGTMGEFWNCAPSKATPVMEIHGTADATVPYNGSNFFTDIPGVMTYWQNYNNCGSATMTAVPDSDPNDGATAIHHVYAPGDFGVTQELFEVTGGGHSWPGAGITIDVTCQDFSASEEIWRFFSQHTLHTAVEEQAAPFEFSVYPNPSTDVFTVSIANNELKALVLYNLAGERVLESTGNNTISVRDLPAGLYFLQAITSVGTAQQTVQVMH